jgi:hypothetical protein
VRIDNIIYDEVEHHLVLGERVKHAVKEGEITLQELEYTLFGLNQLRGLHKGTFAIEGDFIMVAGYKEGTNIEISLVDRIENFVAVGV